MKNILLIGGAGYVGSVITSEFLKRATKLMYLITLFMTINLLLRLTLGILITKLLMEIWEILKF